MLVDLQFSEENKRFYQKFNGSFNINFVKNELELKQLFLTLGSSTNRCFESLQKSTTPS